MIMTNQECINRWAQYIIPAVFKAEDELIRTHPEWKERLAQIDPAEGTQIAQEYCTAIATIIVTNAEDYDPNEKEE